MSLIRAYDATQAQLPSVLQRQYDVDALNALEFFEHSPRTRSQTCPRLPTSEGLPQSICQEANEDVSFGALRFLVPYGSYPQVAFLDPEGGLSLGKLNVEPPELLSTPVRDVGSQYVGPFGQVGPVQPFGLLRLDHGEP